MSYASGGAGGGGAGGAATDTIYDAKGDIAVATGADASAKVTVGANATVLTADSTQASGVKWVIPTGGAITGATAATRYAGATTGGAPTAGTFAVGDLVVDQLGTAYVCVTAGTPGTWREVGIRHLPARPYPTFLGENYDLAFIAAQNTHSAATVIGQKIMLPPYPISVTNVLMQLVTIATSTLTNCFVGLLKSDGTLIGMSADESSANQNWSSTGAAGFKTHALVGGPFTVTPLGQNDFVYGVSYVGATAGTAPKFGALNAILSAPEFAGGLSAATTRAWSQAVASTPTPFASLVMASNNTVAQAQAMWIGIS